MPLPLAPAVIVIHATLLAAVHVHPVAAVTVTLPVTAEGVVRLEEVGEMPGAHGALNANESSRIMPSGSGAGLARLALETTMLPPATNTWSV